MQVEDTTTVVVQPIDEAGYDLHREIEVDVTYTLDIDPNYGADADGRRGMRRVELESVEVEVADPAQLDGLTIEQVAECLRTARETFIEKFTYTWRA